ncbi:proline--tRNA ligase [Dehalobacterium formicoaceticum]|uniref:Proline--tRNA ligase n=1 Tax=Dehalobacterium formicoaceticum TaxID=51515 RepID=A0ABT1Y1H5_9FIRM|nr:proline--tRNA ligase [Dehalobacterium formicoaceticum]MCR6544708.1 proline--tRNA ligase [Dehalobacterium formicoaceticum]
MKASQMFAPTLREVPAEAEIVSHQLLMRSGMLRKTASGVYTYMPLAWRTMKKIMDIIREEMDAAGCQELMLPIVHPAELWQQSGRWQVYGDELWRLKDRHGRDFCLGPTHEEVITDLVSGDVKSYKQLPLRLYQIQNKYRDERRPRFGLMRGREFIMKDMYSFDRDEEGLDESYRLMHQAYTNIFTRCGLDFRPVAADSGAIGGDTSQEFMVLAESGEAGIIYCSSCTYAASTEIAAAYLDKTPSQEIPEDLEEVYTPDCKTMEALTAFLGVPLEKTLKTLCYMADEKFVMVLLRGDRMVNEIKVKNRIGCLELNMAGDEEIRQHLGSPAGYLGPVGVKNIRIIVDQEVPYLANLVGGANKDQYHLRNVNPGRDFPIDDVADVRLVEAGELCPQCQQELAFARGIEAGQIFKLGTKYSESMGAKYLDDNGKEQLMVMGCYGIGVGRTMAAAIEQNHDQDGIVWPLAIAPYHVVVVPVSDKDPDQMAAAEKLYQELTRARVEAVLDDRKERPGVKFKDADLIGYPFRVTIGPKALAEGKGEVKLRSVGKVEMVALDEIVPLILEKMKKHM